MEKNLLINPANGAMLYQLFYILAFLAAYGIIIYEGYRRKFPLLPWVLLLACIRLSVVIGTKIFTFTGDEWRFMIENHTLLPNPQKTMFGGFLLGIAGYLFARHFLKFRHSAWDTVAYAFPIAVSIQAIGCFFYGCCFGNPSSLPWAVQYPVMTLPHYHQFESGLLSYNDLHSLPVHPVQLYSMLGGILALGLTFRFRKYWKAQGSLLLSAMIFFSVTRFITEFFRDPLSNKTGGEMLWFLKQVQWQYLIFAVLVTALLTWREKTYKAKAMVVNINLPGLNLQIAFLLSLIMIVLMLRSWFSLPEIIAINIALLPAVFFVGVEIYRAFASLRYRWIYAFTLLLPLFLMSQTFPETQVDSLKTKTYNTYRTFGGGFATGNYTDQKTIYTGRGCNMVSNTEYFNQKYTAGGMGYNFTKVTPDNKQVIVYGANLLFGNYTQIRQSDNREENKLLLGIGPYIKYDIPWIGIGTGLNLGSLAYTTGDSHKETTETQKGSLKTPIFPQFYFRFGPRRFLYADVHIADQFPVSAPGLAFQTGIGTGLGLRNGMNLRFGFSYFDEGAHYISAYIPIKNRIVIEPMFLWINKSDFMYPFNLPENQFSLGISYRFGHKY